MTDPLGAMCRIDFRAASFQDFHPKALFSLSTILRPHISTCALNLFLVCTNDSIVVQLPSGFSQHQ